MLIEATQHPIRYTLLDGRQVRLAPGHPVHLPDPQARMLLTKAADRVRVIDPLSREALDCLHEEVQVHVATCSRPVYWESGPGKILGPGSVSHVLKAKELDGRDSFWLCVEWNGGWRWVHEQTLRSKKAYAAQPARPP